jgi:hypothetical protein
MGLASEEKVDGLVDDMYSLVLAAAAHEVAEARAFIKSIKDWGVDIRDAVGSLRPRREVALGWRATGGQTRANAASRLASARQKPGLCLVPRRANQPPGHVRVLTVLPKSFAIHWYIKPNPRPPGCQGRFATACPKSRLSPYPGLQLLVGLIDCQLDSLFI